MCPTTLLFFLSISAFFIRSNQEKDDENVYDYFRQKALNCTRFLIAQRVEFRNPEVKAKKSVQDLLKSDVGREELSTIDQLYFGFLEASTQDYYLYYKELFDSVYQTLFASGFLQKWPRYYYDEETSEIVVLPEVISLMPNIKTDDFGPPVPELEKLHVLTMEEIMAKPADIFKHNREWLPDTPEIFKDSNYYELNHIIPLPVLASFCDLFSAVWHTIDAERRKVLSVPFRIANALDVKFHTILDGERLGENILKEGFNGNDFYIGDESDLQFDVKKYILWAPGNLYYGPKNRVRLTEEDEFDKDIEVIIGKKLSNLADSIYNRILDILSQVGYRKIGTSIESRKEKLEKIAKKINSENFLLTQVKEIIFTLVHFGRIKFFPYQMNLTQWKRNDDDKWEIRFDEYLKQKDFEVDERFHIAGLMNKGCNDSSAVISNDEFLNLEYFELRHILTNESNIIYVLRNYFNKFSNHSTTTLTDLSKYVLDEVQSYYSGQGCVGKNLLCSRLDGLCEYNIEDSIDLIKDKVSYREDRICPRFSYKKYGFLSTISFKEWCRGSRFENLNHLTTDSAILRVLTFNTSKSDTLNEKIYCDLYEMYIADDRKIGFLEFVDRELQKVDTAASKILNQACKFGGTSTRNRKSALQEVIERTCYLLSVLSIFSISCLFI